MTTSPAYVYMALLMNYRSADQWHIVARAAGAEPSDRVAPIISMEMANLHIERRWKGQRAGRPCEYTWPALSCVLWLNDGERTRRMYCHRDRYRTHGQGAPTKTFKHADIDAVFLHQLAGLRFTPAAIEHIQAQMSAGQPSAEREQYTQAVKRLQMKIERYQEMYSDGLMDRDEFRAKFNEVQSALNEARSRLARPDETAQRIMQIGTLAETLMQISPRRRRDAITAMIDRVELNAEGEFVKIVWANEFRHALLNVAEICRNDALDRCQAQNFYDSVEWFAERMAA